MSVAHSKGAFRDPIPSSLSLVSDSWSPPTHLSPKSSKIPSKSGWDWISLSYAKSTKIWCKAVPIKGCFPAQPSNIPRAEPSRQPGTSHCSNAPGKGPSMTVILKIWLKKKYSWGFFGTFMQPWHFQSLTLRWQNQQTFLGSTSQPSVSSFSSIFSSSSTSPSSPVEHSDLGQVLDVLKQLQGPRNGVHFHV